MNHNLKIRVFQESDREQIEQISWQVQEWEKKFYPGKAVSKEIIAKHVEKLIQSTKNKGGTILVAVSGKECVGYVAGEIHQDFLNTESSYYVSDMGVNEKKRGKGIGTALLQSIERFAKEECGLTKMMIAVICGNDGAEKLYKRLGFVPYELELVKTI